MKNIKIKQIFHKHNMNILMYIWQLEKSIRKFILLLYSIIVHDFNTKHIAGVVT